MNTTKSILVIGAGMAGCEASYFLANKGYKVILVESKRKSLNPAQKIPDFAELVCTNSLKSMNETSAHGLLKLEMKALGSLILEMAYLAQVPAGDALAVDREQFAKLVTQKISTHPNIQVVDDEAKNPQALMDEYKCDQVIISSGPLTTKALEVWIQENISADDLYFYDAIAPVVDADTLDYDKLYFKDRHKPIGESADYLNAPMNKDEYYKFIEELVIAEKTPAKDFEELKYFESCLPVDTMATRGKDTARFSCMKPIGLETVDGREPFAVVQLRKENLLGSAYNLVGFQTRMTYKEQLRVFRMIPGLENASFIHLGSVHRNSFLNANKLLSFDMSSKTLPHIHFAGQITGVEGYTESASSGLYVAWQIDRKLRGIEAIAWPVETAIGSLINYIMTANRPSPSNVNFGLIPTIELNREQRKNRDRKKIKKQLMVDRAKEVFESFIKEGTV